ncbi:MAG: serine/threonine-protein kinase, partial [Anaerolineae bacterium]
MNSQPGGPAGRQIGPYQIEEAIGQGRMSRMYRGYHLRHKRPAAVKLFSWGLAEDEQFTARFLKEAAAVAALKHPNIVAGDEFGLFDGGYFFGMEFVAGQTVEQLIASGRRPAPAAVQAIITDVASALDYAHANHVLHRNVKPSNIILSEAGGAILADFGLAMLPAGTGHLPFAGLPDAPYYLPSEQAISAAAASPGGDIYALGAVLFELITGTPPYVAGTPLELVLKHRAAPAPNVQDFAPQIPDAVKTVIQRAMAKDPAARFATAAEMAGTLVQVWDTTELPHLPTTPAPGGARPPPPPPPRGARGYPP